MGEMKVDRTTLVAGFKHVARKYEWENGQQEEGLKMQGT